MYGRYLEFNTMQYTRFYCRGYNRISLNHIDSIEIRINERIQLLIGTNGSGKSSIMRAMSHLPANPQDFTKDGHINKDGCKEVESIHRGHHYKSRSVFSPKIHHSFIKDRHELNPGGTAAVQRELVKQEMGVTPELHELMIGRTRFHAMGPQERREWFTRLSETSYHYAIQQYQRLKEEHRDIVGSIKTTHARIAQESSRLLSEEQEAAMRQELRVLQETLNLCLEHKAPLTSKPNDINLRLHSRESTLVKLCKEVQELQRRFINHRGFTSLEDITAAIQATEVQLGSFNYITQEIGTSIQRKEHLLTSLDRANLSGLNDLDAQLSASQRELENLHTKRLLNLVFSDCEGARATLLSYNAELTELFSSMPRNDHRAISRHTHQAQITERQTLNEEIKGLEREEQRLQLEKDHLDKHRDEHTTECPKCQHRWIRGYDPSRYRQVISSLANLQQEIQRRQSALVKLEVDLEESERCLSLYSRYGDITRATPVLKPLWEYILTTGSIFTHPQGLIQVIEDAKYDLALLNEIQKLEATIQEITQLRTLAAQEDQISKGRLTEELEELHQKLFQHNLAIQQETVRLKQLKDHRVMAQKILNTSHDIETLIKEQRQDVELLVDQLKVEMINDCIQHLRLEISEREQRLSQIDIQKALVASLQNQLEEMEVKDRVLKVVVKELSPTDGLIARGLLGFIEYFIARMNGFIRKIWTYPLVVKACRFDSPETIELDYKFPLIVNDGKDPVPDIKEGSTSQKEIVDLAFVIAVLDQLGMMDYPLMLDEFGHSFDPTHRHAAFTTINNLIQYSDFSQLFIVSHFTEQYGSLKNAEVTVLCEANVILPPNTLFNQHVTIT